MFVVCATLRSTLRTPERRQHSIPWRLSVSFKHSGQDTRLEALLVFDPKIRCSNNSCERYVVHFPVIYGGEKETNR